MCSKRPDMKCIKSHLSYLLKTVCFFSLALILLASSIIKDSFIESHGGGAAAQKGTINNLSTQHLSQIPFAFVDLHIIF